MTQQDAAESMATGILEMPATPSTGVSAGINHHGRGRGCVITRRALFSASHLYRLPELSDEENVSRFGRCSLAPYTGSRIQFNCPPPAPHRVRLNRLTSQAKVRREIKNRRSLITQEQVAAASSVGIV